MTQEQSGTEAETGAGLNAARAVTGVESWPDEEVWLTGRVEQRQEHDTAHVLYQYIFIDEVGFNLGPITLPVSSSSWMACMTCWYHLTRQMTHKAEVEEEEEEDLKQE
ncbi:unnamed protein product [Pleuronectes platessa]|uniref:Uncharacterized protein n=1 Tax=Pleuronectes platessa TaxID=8262 RepID=A0A9N7VYV7_PLEPL|nr:unnamed protein product [Pleuronectes platessa]